MDKKANLSQVQRTIRRIAVARDLASGMSEDEVKKKHKVTSNIVVRAIRQYLPAAVRERDGGEPIPEPEYPRSYKTQNGVNGDGHFLVPRTFKIIADLLTTEKNPHQIAEIRGVSHQRVYQIVNALKAAGVPLRDRYYAEATGPEPELGQIVSGRPMMEFGVPRYAAAFLDAIIERIRIAHWNKKQTEWDGLGDPEIPGAEWNPYWWGDDDAPEAQLPNFAFGGVHIRWYKHPGRGMSCNVNWTPENWSAWFEKVMDHIQEFDNVTFDELINRPNPEALA